jgi:uncharacterized protein
MYCPVCSTPLRAVERQGVPIDYCPQCQGLWLDQGELDELIRREALAALLQGQEVLIARRQERSYDRVDHEAPPRALSLGELRQLREARP